MSWLPTRLRRRRDGAWTGQGGAALILALLFILIVTVTSLAVAPLCQPVVRHPPPNNH